MSVLYHKTQIFSIKIPRWGIFLFNGAGDRACVWRLYRQTCIVRFAHHSLTLDYTMFISLTRKRTGGSHPTRPYIK